MVDEALWSNELVEHSLRSSLLRLQELSVTARSDFRRRNHVWEEKSGRRDYDLHQDHEGNKSGESFGLLMIDFDGFGFSL